jgi:hypothetical protein
LFSDPSVALSFSKDDSPSLVPSCSIFCIRKTALCTNLHQYSFQAFDIHCTTIEADALFILPLHINKLIHPGIIVFRNKMPEWYVN